MAIPLKGFLKTDAGVAIETATVDVFARNTTTPVVATVNTDADGMWSFSITAQGRYDVRITNGSSIRWRKYDTQEQFDAVEVANFRIRNPADTFEYDIVPAAITAARQLNLPLITGTDTLMTLGLAQTVTGILTLTTPDIGAATGTSLVLTGNLSAEDLLIEDSDASHYLTITTTSNLTAARTLTIVPGDASRTITLSGDTTLSGTNTGDVTLAGTPNYITLANQVLTLTKLDPADDLNTFASSVLATLVTDETGSGALVFGTAPTLAGGAHTALTGLGIRSTGTGAFDMTIANAENLTVGRTLTIQLGDAARTLILGASPSLSGTNTGDQTITLTGDVTGSGTGSFAATIANDAVTLAKMANMATGSLLGRNTAGTGDPEVITDIATAITIGGAYITRVGGTDVTVADGGTGLSATTVYAVLCGGTTTTGALQSIASVGTSGQVLTSNGAGALPTFQAAGGGGGAVTRAGGNTTEATTTSTSSVDLLSATSLSIAAGTWMHAVCAVRKSVGAAAGSRTGATVNATLIIGNTTWSGTAEAAQSGWWHLELVANTATYLQTAYLMYGSTTAGTPTTLGPTTANMPAATITSIINNSYSLDAAITTGADELQVYTYATS